MDENLTGNSKQESDAPAETEITVPVMLGHSEEATLIGASQAGPRVERAEARQQRDDPVAAAPKPQVNVSDITDYKAFVAFLHNAGFSRAFAKRVTNRDAFKSAAEPSDENSPAAEAVMAKLIKLAELLKE